MPPSYHKFYWPLALSGLALLLEHQFQNGILARYPDAERELAIFALATSSFQLVNAPLIFIPQMVAVLARTPADRARCRRFAHLAGLTLSLPLFFLGYTETGRSLLGGLMNIPPSMLPAVARYLQWLTPLDWVNAVRHYCTGMLVLSERTRTVTMLNLVHLVTLVILLLVGRQAVWQALPTLALATVVSNLLHFFLGIYIVRRVDVPVHQQDATRPTSISGIFGFFWPLAVTSLFFAMSRPVLYAFVNLTSDAVVTIAVLRVGFDFCMLFQNPVNQFRHLYATYGAVDPEGVARFMFSVTGVLTAVMAMMVVTPLSRLFFGHGLGLEGEVLLRSLQSIRVLLLVPLIIMIRNLYHGRLMVRRTTRAMAAAALFRVAAIALAAKGLLAAGLLNHVSGAALLVLGFVVETVIVRDSVRRSGVRRCGHPLSSDWKGAQT